MTSKPYTHLLESLKPGDLFTMVKFSEFGFLQNIQGRVFSIELTKYAQYDKAVKFVFIPKGCRKKSGFYLYDQKSVIVWPGHIPVKTEMFNAPRESNGLTIRESIYRSFDAEYLNDALKSTDREPIFMHASELDEVEAGE